MYMNTPWYYDLPAKLNREFAEKYPSAQVIGIDMTPIQPLLVVPNLSFIMADFNSSTYGEGENEWDFIHARELKGSVRDWQRFLDIMFK